eukprot:TRINITY_DN13843_c0_g2_i1.p1 TRINITY_DN13843_c0_g2~~TRINITY_DN13843_c0_g2_i1.p1  ORF type:complete len:120 (+),score=17.99 TRINITY_DN13843_c0_g2_i1:110-469(+)
MSFVLIRRLPSTQPTLGSLCVGTCRGKVTRDHGDSEAGEHENLSKWTEGANQAREEGRSVDRFEGSDGRHGAKYRDSDGTTHVMRAKGDSTNGATEWQREEHHQDSENNTRDAGSCALQ